jgi:hypothetical protein
MTSKIFKSAMRKWKHCISLILKNLTITLSYWRKRKKKIMRIMSNWRKNNQYWTIGIWTLENSMKKKIKSLRISTKTLLQITKGSTDNSKSSKESLSIFRSQIWRGIMKSNPWMKKMFNSSNRRLSSVMLSSTTNNWDLTG